MQNSEELVKQLTLMMQQQTHRMEEERKASAEREARMQALLERAITRAPGTGNEHVRNTTKVPNNATPAPILLQNATLREFTTWNQKFEDYILLTGIDKLSNDEQKAVLRSLLDDEWFRITKFALNINMDDDTITIHTIIDKMKAHLRSQRNVVIDRKEFYSRNQQSGEKFDDYLIALQEIASFCDFCPNCIDNQFRDRIVTGIQSEETVKNLLSEKKLTYDKAIAICRANENANKDSESLASACSVNKVTKYTKPQTKQITKPPDKRRPQNKCKFCEGEWHRYLSECPVWRRQNQNPKKMYKCRSCGREHYQKSECPARDKNCGNCGTVGHFARFCINTVSEEDSDYSNTFSVTIAGLNNEVEHKKTPKVVLKATFGSKVIEIESIPDTGAEMSVVGIEVAQKLGANLDNLKRNKHKLYAANKERLHCLGILPVLLSLGQKQVMADLIVVHEVTGFLLAWYHAIKLGILPENFPSQINEISCNSKVDKHERKNPPQCSEKNPSNETRKLHERKLLETFKTVFDIGSELKPMKGKPMRILLKENSVPFAITAARKIPFAWKFQIKKQLEEMVEKGIIEEVLEPTDWCHPIVPVPKKGSTEVRLCVDLTRLNQYVRRGAHPVLTSLEAVNSISKGSQFFTSLDAKAGYWQIPIAEEDQILTTFITPYGRYKFLRAPMGLTTSGDEYNRRGDEALQGTENTVKVVDDILSYDENYQKHLNTVWSILSKCEEYGITLNPSKFKFAEKEVDYCGYHINSEGYTINKRKIEAITNFKTPSNLLELKSFMGLVNQFNQFSPNISNLAEPLRHLLKKDTEWGWNESHEKAFVDVKTELSSPPILSYYDPTLPVILQTDAAKLKGLGYICLQKHKTEWKMIECGSRFLTDSESRYATIELELLAIAWAVKKCHIYLAGRDHFDIVTDHKPLLPIVNKKGLSEIENPRLLRLRERLLPYSFVLGWKKGVEHAIPDALSRFPVQKPTHEDELAERELNEIVHASINANIKAIFEDGNTNEDVLVEEVRQACKRDEEHIKLKQTIIEGFPSNYNELDPLVRPYVKMKDLLSIDGDLVICGQRLVIPRIMRREILNKLHSSHQGIERTRRRARHAVYWPGIDNDLKNIVESCQKCQILQPSLPKEPMIVEKDPSHPFEKVSADYFQYAGKQYLIYTDRLSGWPMVKMFTREATANMLISILREFFAAVGAPTIFRCDNGPQFNSYTFRSFMAKWKVQVVTSSPYYHQSNGHAESSVKSVKYLIIKSTNNGNLDSDEFATSLLELRNTPRSDGRSPSQILFGRPTRSIVPLHRRAFMKHWQPDVDKCQSKKTRIQIDKQARYNVNAKTLPSLPLGTMVYLQNPQTGRWDMSGKIIKIGNNRQYLVRKNNGFEVWRNRRFLRKKHMSSCYVGPFHNESNDINSRKKSEKLTPVKSPRSKYLNKGPISAPSSFAMPKINPSKIIKSEFKLPPEYFQTFKSGVRSRHPPQRIQVDPRQKKY